MSAANDATFKSSLKPDPGPSYATNAPHTLSVSELRTAMQQHLRRNGTLKTLKTHIRGMMLTELMHQQKRLRTMAAPQRAPPDRDGVISPKTFEELRRSKRCEIVLGEPPQEPDQSPSSSPFTSWASCIADTLIEEHLRATRRTMTLSIFSTEVEVPPLSDIGAPSDERERLEQLLFVPNSITQSGEGESLVEDGVPRISVLQRLVMQRLIQGDGRPSSQRPECGTQTDNDPLPLVAGEPPASLECRLAAVDAKYALAFSRLGHGNDSSFFTRAEVERRLSLYKNDIHEQLRGEYQQKYKHFEENKLREAKETLEARYQLMIQNKNEELREMERSLLVKYEQERQRLQRTREDVERQRLDIERHQKEMRTIVSDYEAQLLEQDTVQKELREKLRVSQLQSAKWEELSGSRLMEVEAARSREQRRVDDIRRMQADHAAELRLKDEELSRLRFRIRTLVNCASDRLEKGEAKKDNGAPGAVQNDLYGMLVRTEELQRNALQQQQSWMMQASQEQQQHHYQQQQQQQQQPQWPQEFGGGTVWGGPSTAPFPKEVPSSTAPPRAAAVAMVEKTAAPEVVATAAPPLPTVSALRESPALEPVGGDTSQLPRASTASEDPAGSPFSGSASRKSFQEERNTNAENQPSILERVPTNDSSTLSNSSSSASNDRELSTQIKEKNSKDSDTSTVSNAAATSEEAIEQAAALAQILEEEETLRKQIHSIEDSEFKGIQWTEKSQRAVLEAQLQERRAAEADPSGDSRGVNFSMNRFAPQQQQQFGEADIIFGDDTDEDDSVLFNKNGSTDSSF